MENQTRENNIPTNAENNGAMLTPVKSETVQGVVLSTKDVEEYRAYKRRKMVEEIMSAMSKSEGTLLADGEIQRVCEHALRLKQAALQIPMSKMLAAKKTLSSEKNVKKDVIQRLKQRLRSKKQVKADKKSAAKVCMDCIIGGNGETSTFVKVYEAKQALRRGAKELTLMLTPSMIRSGNYTEIRKEVRKIYRLRKKLPLKVAVDSVYPAATISRLARLASEVGAKYFSVPYFVGCDRVRFDLINGCKLQVVGDFTLEEYKKLLTWGIARVVTTSAWEIYEQWMKETEKIEFAKPALLVRESKETTKEYKDEKPLVQPQTKQPLPLSKVMQSGVLVETRKDVEEEKKTL